MKSMMFLGGLGTGEIIVIAVVVLLLFGGKKIPELMRGLGKGVRSFKEGLNDNGTNEPNNSTNANESEK